MKTSDSIFAEISAYTDFLSDLGYHISFSLVSPALLLHYPYICKYDTHRCPVCYYMRRNPSTMSACHKNKLALIKKAPKFPYYGCCYAGVEEYVFPILNNGIPIVFIHVYGYRDHMEKSRKMMQYTAKRCTPQYPELYNALSSDPPPSMEKVRSFVDPYKYMFTALYNECLKSYDHSRSNLLLNEILQYIHNHYTNDLSYEKIAHSLHYSKSYLRHFFQQQTNKTIKQYILALRLEYAVALMTSSDYNIAEIAMLCGFNNPNYFSIAFKKEFGMTPLQYRENASLQKKQS